jgi:hypothetical protein
MSYSLSSLSLNTNKRNSLFSLPPELREAIWVQTFEPRTITIEYHEGKHPSWGSAARPYFYWQTATVACIIFTASVGVGLANPLDPYLYSAGQRMLAPRGTPSNNTIHYGMKKAVPPGPVALAVCRESRAISLKRYQLAFAGKNLVPNDQQFQEQWMKGGFGQPKVWLDFERDVIFIDRGKEYIGQFGGTAPTTVMDHVIHHAKEDMKKIKNLAMRGTWGLDRPIQHPRHRGLGTFLLATVKELTSLKNLVVYHSDQLSDAAPIIRKEADEVLLEILEALKKRKEVSPNWTAELPRVTVVKENGGDG